MIEGVLTIFVVVIFLIGLIVGIASLLGEKLGCLFLLSVSIVFSYLVLPLWVSVFWVLLILLAIWGGILQYLDMKPTRSKAVILSPEEARILRYQERRHVEETFLQKRGKIKVLSSDGFDRKVREFKWSKRKQAYWIQEGFTKDYYISIEEFQRLESKGMEGNHFLVRIVLFNQNGLDLKLDEREYQRMTRCLTILKSFDVRQRQDFAKYFHQQANRKNWVDRLIEVGGAVFVLGVLVFLAMEIASMMA